MSYYLSTLICNWLRNDDYHKMNLEHLWWVKTADLALLIILMWYKQLYFQRRPNWEEVRITYRNLANLCLINLPVLFLSRNERTLLLIFIFFWLIMFVTIPVLRSLSKLVMFNIGIWQRSLYIIGINDNAINAYNTLSASRLLGYYVEGFVSLKKTTENELRIGRKILPILDINQLFNQNKSCEIVICLEERYLSQHIKLINSLQKKFTAVTIMPQLEGLPLYGIEVNHFFGNEQLMLRLENNLSSRFNRTVKLLFDYLITLILLPILILLLLIISVVIYLEDNGYPFFIQQRVGKNGFSFGCIKFRTMHKDAEKMLAKWKNHNDPLYLEYVANNYKLPNDPRVTRIGKILRKTSLDELPQLINVLLGNMSLVGPRPLLADEITEYSDGLFYYSQVRPGITGLWQISGRSKTSFKERSRLDSWYIKNWSLWYDIVILLKTPWKVLKSDGAY
jgi:undecaprenyl-phosphate galactose phosphotransferase